MKKIRLEKVDSHFKNKLKDKAFRAEYELERAKVALAQKMADLRHAKKWKQTDLARVLDVSQQFVSQIETAQEKNLTLDTLTKIAQSLGRDLVISFPKVVGRTPRLIVAPEK